jgi:hypothetical protein
MIGFISARPRRRPRPSSVTCDATTYRLAEFLDARISFQEFHQHVERAAKPVRFKPGRRRPVPPT